MGDCPGNCRHRSRATPSARAGHKQFVRITSARRWVRFSAAGSPTCLASRLRLSPILLPPRFRFSWDSPAPTFQWCQRPRKLRMRSAVGVGGPQAATPGPWGSVQRDSTRLEGYLSCALLGDPLQPIKGARPLPNSAAISPTHSIRACLSYSTLPCWRCQRPSWRW